MNEPITVTMDFRTIEDSVGYENHNGNIKLVPWDVPTIQSWIDRKLTGTVPANTTIELIWVHMPDWMSVKIGQHLDSKAKNIIMSTPRIQNFVVKGDVN